METDKSGITEEVAGFVEAIRFEDFSPGGAAHRQALHHRWDRGHPCGCRGTLYPYRAATTSSRWRGREESTLLGQGGNRVPAHLAALVNGTAGHAMDWDDTALSTSPDRAVLLHPTLQPLAAGLAIGEKLGVSGRDFLTAFLTGFEVECKIAESIHPDHWLRGLSYLEHVRDFRGDRGSLQADGFDGRAGPQRFRDRGQHGCRAHRQFGHHGQAPAHGARRGKRNRFRPTGRFGI